MLSTYSSGSKTFKSAILSPTPTKLTGILSFLYKGKTIPPFAVPSNFVNMAPVRSDDFLNYFACTIEF